MNKKLVAAAIAAAMAAPAAYADATVYGRINASVDSIDTAAGTQSDWNVESRGSRLGFKGSEDLGNGMSAIYMLEFSVDIDGNTTALGQREQFVGLAGNFGTVRIGKYVSPLLRSTSALDLFADTISDYNSSVGFTESRLENSVQYASPSFSGLTIDAAIVAAENTANKDAYSASAVYKNGGIHASVAYADGTDGGTNDTWKVGLGYKMDAYSVALIYQDVDTGTAATTGELWQVQGSYAMGNNTIKASYGNNSLGTSDLDAWAIGVDHKMSKRTKVFALYADSEVALNSTTGTGAADGFSLGMQHNF